MKKLFKIFLVGAILWGALATVRKHQHARLQAHRGNQAMQEQLLPFHPQSPPASPAPRPTRHRRSDFSAHAVAATPPSFVPMRNLYDLSRRGCSDEELSGFIVQTELIKKDSRLGWQQHDIDDCNGLVLSYVQRGVRENSNYFLRRRLVECFGQTSHTKLIDHMRLVAVLLGGEKGSGGMDPSFRAIREEAHRISPYVIVLVENYIKQLEARMAKAKIDQHVDDDFKQFVSSLSERHYSEYGVADIGRKRYRNKPAEELYALKVLLKDLKIYYGETEGGSNVEEIFSNPGSFQSDVLTTLKRRHRSMPPGELADALIELGLQLRDHLSEIRENRRSSRGHSEEIEHLKKLTGIAATAPGLFASERTERDPVDQAQVLVNLLFLEGLYSKKQRKRLLEELSARPNIRSDRPQAIKAFYTFLNYMHGLAFAKMDEALGDAARAYVRHTPVAENFLEIQARKSALQVLGQLQQEFYQTHSSILRGTQDIHLAGTARGLLRVFQSEREISRFLQTDPRNGATTIWVLKSGLTMPNEASFAAIIMEDPIIKASHYDGFARSKNPPIPLLQIPNATRTYAQYHDQPVVLEASKEPHEKVSVRPSGAGEASPPKAITKRVRLPHAPKSLDLIEIHEAKADNEILEMRQQVGAKAANYAFLRSHLPRDPTKNEEHIYAGFAIPFYHYGQHLTNHGIDSMIASLGPDEDPERTRATLAAVRHRILNARVDRRLLESVCRQIEERLKAQHRFGGDILKLRFRSSSNAEDNQHFSGAGLYESHAVYFQMGRSLASNHDAVAGAIKQVWASVWKPEAYHAREQAGILQQSVRMGILVHPSYRKEESTGVVYYHGPNDIEIAVNKGNANVQNPEIAGLVPEFHRITHDGHEVAPSSCHALSEEVILSKKDRKQLMTLLNGVIPKFRELYSDLGPSDIDIEFKVLELPDGKGDEKDVVMLKQIRPLAKHAKSD